MKPEFDRCVERIQFASGRGAKIAILDSGVDLSNRRLRASTRSFFDCRSQNGMFSIEERSDSKNFDPSRHGSLVQTCFQTVAPDAAVDHYKILDDKSQCDISLLCYVFDHVLEQDYNIINLSLGTRNEQYLPWLVNAMRRAYEKNVIVVASASNVSNVLYPARFTFCLSVGAMDASSTLAVKYQERSVVELSGWGVNVPVEIHSREIEHVSGTSFAAAHVSGIVARAIESYGTMSMSEMKVLLKQYSELYSTSSLQLPHRSANSQYDT